MAVHFIEPGAGPRERLYIELGLHQLLNPASSEALRLRHSMGPVQPVDLFQTEVDVDEVQTIEDLMAVFARVLRFPYHNDSQDGFLDWLRDLSWLPAQHYLVEVPRASRLWCEAQRAAGLLVEMWHSAEWHCWLQREVHFSLVFIW